MKLLAFCCVAITSALGFQAATRPEAAGVTIHGKVLQDPGGQPVRKANVLLLGEASRHSTTTDGEGSFSIGDLSPGNYRISFEHPGFVDASSAQKSSLLVEAGKDVAGLVFYMHPAGVISGKILDRDGDPMKGVTVSAVGLKSLLEIRPHRGTETTNDLGEFRISDLAADLYEVSATSSAEPPRSNDSKKQDGRVVYGTTYFPGTLDKGQATPVEVQAGNETPVSFGLLTTRVYRATGRVVGMHNGEMGRLMVTSRGGESASQGSDLRENGEFDMNDLLPGSYKAHLMLFSFTGTKPEGKFAELSPPIEVEHDLTGLTLQIEPTVVVHGKFRMDKGSNPDWRQLNVTLNPLSESTNQEFGEMFVPPLWSPVSSDGSFELRDAQTERYQVVVGSSSSSLRDYFTKAVEVNGHDMIDSGFEIQSGISLDIIVSANGATIEGIVTNKKGNPVPGAAVVSIPSAEHHLRRDLYEQEKTNANGHFSLRGLSPGEYSILAFEDLDEDFRQPNFLKSYEGISEKVQVGEGDNKSIDLKLIPAQSGTDK